MIRGIIYMYTSPNGKSYIGQTINEKLRRKLWNSVRYHYAGDKIDRARAKYGKEAFTYEVLFEKNFSSKDIASIWLNIAEQYYIRVYDSVENGYNCEYGGGGNSNHAAAKTHRKGYKLSEEARQHIGEGVKFWVNTPEGKAKLSKARKGKSKKSGYRLESKFKPVVQLSLDGNFIREYSSIRDAEESLLKGAFIKNRTSIGPVCNGKRDSAEGFKWLFSDDYYTYFLHPEIPNIPQRVQRALDAVIKRNTPKVKKKYPHKPKPKKEGPRINRFAQQIGQYNLNLELVKVWRNALDAAHALGIIDANIYRSTRTLGIYMGYYWRKYNGEQTILPKPKKIIKKPKAQKKVVQMNMDGEVLHTYNSIGDACKAVGANNRALMSRCLNKKAKTAYGFMWKFLNYA